jgi:hypothetical protein
MTYAIYVVRAAATDSLHNKRNLWLTKDSKPWTHLSRSTCLFRSFNSDHMEESSRCYLYWFTFCFILLSLCWISVL